MGAEVRIPKQIADLYDKFKFCEHFGIASSYDEVPQHEIDWFLRFMRMDAEVEAEVNQRSK